MRYLVDGHNAIFALDLDELGDRKTARAELLRRVRETRPEAIVFFDARRSPRHLPHVFTDAGVRVVYCRDVEADEEILTDVMAAKHPADVTVVTNDRRLADRVKQLNAHVRTIQDALRMPRPPHVDEKADAPTDYDASDFGLPDEIDLDDPNLRI